MSVSNATAIPTALSHDVTGGYPLHNPEIPNAEPSDCMESIVAWLKNDETPLILKAGAVFAGVIATVAAGFAIGYPLLVSVIVLIPTTVWAVFAWYQLSSKENAAQEASANAQRIAALIVSRADAAQQALNAIKEAVGGEAAFNALPVLNLGDSTGGTGYLDFLQPNNLAHSVMRGADGGGRPFISLKLNAPSNAGHPSYQTVITFFQRFATGGEWTWGSQNYHGNPVHFGDRLAPQDLAIIRQIVIDRNHPQFSLV